MRPRTLALTAGFASILAILTIIVTADQLSSGLASAYSYPTADGVSLSDAASMTLAYLFTIAGIALVVALLFAFLRSLSGTRFGWWLGAAFALLGLAFAVYNATQVLPTLVKVVLFLPVVAGIAWLALPASGGRGSAKLEAAH